MFWRKVTKGLCALGLVVVLSSSSLVYAGDRGSNQKMHAPSVEPENYEGANLGQKAFPEFEEISAFLGLEATPPTDKDTASTQPAASRTGIYPVAAISQDEIVIEEQCCFCDCLSSAGVSALSVLICLGVCLIGVVPACAVCVGVHVGLIITCSALCL